MQYDDDVAFQRAILANPADTTLKLVYADWLQDRADPRAEYVRAQVDLARAEEALKARRPYTFPTSPLQAQIERENDAKMVAEACENLVGMGKSLDPKWVGFMQSLAQPFEPLMFREGEPGHPFTEPIGLCGRIAMLESQYRAVDIRDDGLLADLAFLSGIEWGLCASGAADFPIYGFVCGLPAYHNPLTAREVLTTIKAAKFRSEHIPNLDVTEIPYPGYHPFTANDEIHTDFAEQYMFSREAEGTEDVENTNTHGLKRYVSGGRLWYVLLHIGEKAGAMVALLAVGQSPNGNRLVGAITSQMCHSLCE